MVAELTAGNPLFVEECARQIDEHSRKSSTISLEAADASLSLYKKSGDIHQVLAARIDEQRGEVREFVSASSAIGPSFNLDVLEKMISKSSREIQDIANELIEANLIYQTEPASQREFRFKHSITHAVAYQSMTRLTRQKYHRRVLDAYETSMNDGEATQYAEVLSEHAKRAGDTWRAVSYQRLFAQSALERSANDKCLTLLEECAELAAQLEESPVTSALQVDIMFDLRNCLEIIDSKKIFAVLERAEDLCAKLSDDRRKGLLASYMTHACWVAGKLHEALDYGQQGIAIGTRLKDDEIRLPSLYHSALVLLSLGQHSSAVEKFEEVIASENTSGPSHRFGLNVSPSLLARTYMARCLAEMGQFIQARNAAESALEQAASEREHYAMAFAQLALGHTAVIAGDYETAINWLRQSSKEFKASDAKVMFPISEAFLGYAMTLAGDAQAAVPIIEAAIKANLEAKVHVRLALRMMFLSEALMQTGNIDRSLQTLDEARAIAQKHDDQPSLAYVDLQTVRLSSELAGHLADADVKVLHSTLKRAEGMQMMPLAARCRQMLETRDQLSG
jgi:tetratricopeptide (TPR) repeat protein